MSEAALSTELGEPITTVQQHILHEQKRFPGASGEFSWLLSGITMATKLIQAILIQLQSGLGQSVWIFRGSYNPYLMFIDKTPGFTIGVNRR